MNGIRPRHWLNPHYQRSETGSSSSRHVLPSQRHSSLQAFSSSSSLRTEVTMKRILACLPKSWTKLNNLTSSLSSLLSSRSELNDKKVVMEGVLPTTKASLMSFLKGMGLRPKVEYVGQETIISADMSVINDECLKKRFLDVIKMQVINTPAASSEYDDCSSTNTSASSKKSQPPKPVSHDHENQNRKVSRRDSRTSAKSDRLSPRSSETTEPENRRRRTTRMDSKSSERSEHFSPEPFETSEPKESSKRNESHRGSKTSVCSDAEPTSSGSHHSEYQSADDLPPVPWGPKKKKEQDKHRPSKQKEPEDQDNKKPTERKKSNENIEPSFEKLPTEGQNQKQPKKKKTDKNKKGVRFEMDNKSRKKSGTDVMDYQISNLVTAGTNYETYENNNSQVKKPKKLRIMKHLRRWISGTKKVATPYDVPVCHVVNRCEYSSGNAKNSPSERSFHDRGSLNCAGGDFTPNCEQRPLVRHVENINNVIGLRRQIDRTAADKKPLDAFDGSISMPVLVTPDLSCFKTKKTTNKELTEGSKSTTKARSPLEEDSNSYSVVGDSAAIHIAKNTRRIRLEGKDVKYGSILHKDECFDDHFKVLKEDSLRDIEYQVNKVKERIMFARAIDVGGKLLEDAPEVNLKALLWPEEMNKDGKAKNNQFEVVTKSSFYQKFLASMNILKCTNRMDACDRSVMTDSPLSRTYAEFISATSAMNNMNCDSYKKKRKNVTKERPLNDEHEATSIGDSSRSLPSCAYISKFFQCWDPTHLSKRNQTEKPNRKLETSKAMDEKILKCVANKVVDSSSGNKKKGYIKSD